MVIGLSMSVRQVLRSTLTLAQTQKLKFYIRELEEKIHGPQLNIQEEYLPGCPKCNVVAMYKPDGVMYKCISCGHRFTDAQAVTKTFYKVRQIGSESVMQVPRYDIIMLKEKISTVSPFVTPVALHNSDNVLYINLLAQFGSLASAFATVGIVYANPAKESWQTTVIDYLGIIPDSQIAKIVGVSHTQIWLLRQRFGIPTAGENFEDLPIDDDTISEIREFNNQKLIEAIETWGKASFLNVKKIVKEVISQNPGKPDREICQIVFKQGIKVSRRTVNKYRNEAGSG